MEQPSLQLLVVPFALVGLLATACSGDGGGENGPQCGPGQTEIDGVCELVDNGGCGEGAAQVDGACVPLDELCPGGQVYADGLCRTETACGEGTVEADDGSCVVDPELCESGQVYLDGTCRNDRECGTGTAEVDGECVPDDDLCPTGQAWVGGECVVRLACGGGTLELSGECVPIDPFADADLLEGEENNDLYYDGTPTAFDLPETEGVSVLLGGYIEPARDLDGVQSTLEPDFDSWVFDGTAGQRLRIESTALGVPATAFVVQRESARGELLYQRFALPIATRNAAREVVLPENGRYEIRLSDRANLFRAWGFALSAGGYDGADDYGYLLAVTLEPAPEPTENDSGNLELGGDALDLPQIELSADLAGSLVSVSIEGHNRDVFPSFFLTTVDGQELIDDTTLARPPRSSGVAAVPQLYYSVPEGGLLITVDYWVAAADDTGFDLSVARAEVTDLTLAEPFEAEGLPIAPGGASVFRHTSAAPFVLRATADPGGSAATLALEVFDASFRPVALCPDPTSYAPSPESCSLEIALGAGAWYLVVLERSALDDIPGTFQMNVTLERSPLLVVGDPLEPGHASVSALDLSDLGAVGDVLYTRFDVGALGTVTLSADPGADLSLAVELFDRPLLALNGESTGGGHPAALGLGEALEGSVLAAPGALFLKLTAADVAGGEAPDVTLDLAGSFTAAQGLSPLVGEVEPNDLYPLEPAGDLGTLQAEPVFGWGALWARLTPPGYYSWDLWAFDVATPSRVRIETALLGAGQTNTIIYLFQEVAPGFFVSLRSNDDGADAEGSSIAPFSAIALDADVGHYLLEVDPANGQDGYYLLRALVESTYDLCIPRRRICLDGERLGRCNPAGDAFTEESHPCALGCDLEGNHCGAIEEVEPNNTAATGQDLDVGGASDDVLDEGLTGVTGEVGGVAVDWYTFSLDGPSRIRITTEPDGPAGVDYVDTWLYSAEGDLLGMGDYPAYREDPPPEPVVNELLADLPAGDYFFRITAEYSDESAGYLLFFDLQALACVPGDAVCADAATLSLCNKEGSAFDWVVPCAVGCNTGATGAECDGVTEDEGATGNVPPGTDLDAPGADPNALDLGLLPVTGALDTGDERDIDWYHFTVPRDGAAVTLEVATPPESYLDTAMWLYRDDGALDPAPYPNLTPCGDEGGGPPRGGGGSDCVAADDDGAGWPNPRIEVVLDAGTYLLRVETWAPFDESTGPYTLYVTTAPYPVCGNGDVELGEACDDGNPDSVDGCTLCELDFGFECDLESEPTSCEPYPDLGTFAAGETIPDYVSDRVLNLGESALVSLTLTEPVRVSGMVTTESLGDPDLSWRDASGVEVFGEIGAGPPVFEGVTLQAGTYYLEVFPSEVAFTRDPVEGFTITLSTEAAPSVLPTLTELAWDTVALGGRLLATGTDLDATELAAIGSDAAGYTTIAVGEGVTILSSTQVLIEVPTTVTPGADLVVGVAGAGGGGDPLPVTVVALLFTEVDAHGAAANDAEAFVEIFTYPPEIDLSGAPYSLVFVAGEDGLLSADPTALSVTTNAQGFALAAPASSTLAPALVLGHDIPDGPYDAVALVEAPAELLAAGDDLADIRVIDAVVYSDEPAEGEVGTFENVSGLWSSGAGQVDTAGAGSAQRCGLSWRDQSEWVIAAPTPGAPSTCE